MILQALCAVVLCRRRRFQTPCLRRVQSSYHQPFTPAALILALFVLGVVPTHAATSYWDSNGPTAGAADTPMGTWERLGD